MPEAPARTRIVIVADVLLYREGLVASLGNSAELEVIGAASTSAEAAEIVGQRLPDVVIVDMAMPGALQLIRDLRADTPETRVLAFAIAEDVSSIMHCAEAGAAGYVTANASIGDLISAITRAAAGELLCTPRVAAALFRRLCEPRARQDPGRLAAAVLSAREREVLAFVRRGLSNKEIASALTIAESTVKNHVHHLLEKLEVGTRQQAAIQAMAFDARLGKFRQTLATIP